MIAEWLASSDEWLIFGALIVSFVGAAEIGFQLAAHRRSPLDDAAATQSATVQASVLGLLALLLGFAFAMAVSRFEARTQLVVDEANAIGTAVLRAQLLPDPQRQNAIRLLRTYVEIRLEFHEASDRSAALDDVDARAERIRNALWTEARAVAERDNHAVTVGLFVASLNEMFDVASKQLAAVRNRVPIGIFAVLFFVAVIAVGLTGYGPGIAEARNLRVTLLVSLLIATVIVLIIDLDRPTSGIVKISPQSLIDVKAGIDRQPI